MAHGHDEISMRILKICGSSACRPLQITLREKCPNTEFFLLREYLSVFSPNVGKYGPEKTLHLDTFHFSQHFVPVHKNNYKQLVRNCCPICLLLICDKIFEFILCNTLLNFLNQKMILFLQFSLVSSRATLVLINYYE